MTQGFVAGAEGAPGQGNGEHISRPAARLRNRRGCWQPCVAVQQAVVGVGSETRRGVGCRHSLQRALEPWGRGSEPIRGPASWERMQLGGGPAEGPAPACRASPAFRGTASTPLPSAEAPLPSVCRLCPPGQQSCRERGVPAWCVWGGGSAASIWLPARPAPCLSRCSTFPAASSCQPGLRPTGSGRLGLSEDSPSLGAHRGGFLAFPLVPAGR